MSKQLTECKTMETTTKTRQVEIEMLEHQGCGYTKFGRIEERADGWLYYDGVLELDGVEIKELKKMEVSGGLFLRGSSIERLEDVKVGGCLYLKDTRIKELNRVFVEGGIQG